MAEHEPPVLIPEGDDDEMVALITSWRYAGPATSWDEIVGHSRQVQRCQELLAKLSRSAKELARLRIRLVARPRSFARDRRIQAEVELLLAPKRAAIIAIAEAVLAAPGRELAGEPLQEALRHALGTREEASSGR